MSRCAPYSACALSTLWPGFAQVQHMCDAFACEVYLFHARVALLTGDLSEYIQCQVALCRLVGAHAPSRSRAPLRADAAAEPSVHASAARGERAGRVPRIQVGLSTYVHSALLTSRSVLYAHVTGQGPETVAAVRRLRAAGGALASPAAQFALGAVRAASTGNYVTFFRVLEGAIAQWRTGAGMTPFAAARRQGPRRDRGRRRPRFAPL